MAFETGQLVVALEFHRLQVALVSIPRRSDEVHGIADYNDKECNDYRESHNQRLRNEMRQRRYRGDGGRTVRGVAKVEVQVNWR